MKKYPKFSRTLAFLLVLAMLLPMISMTAFSQDLPCEVEGCSGRYDNGFCTKDASHFEAPSIASDTYRITNAGQLYWFAELVNSSGNEYDGDNGCVYNAYLDNDIVINADMDAENKREWIPIGLYTSAREYVGFSGMFDGNGHTIYGLYYDNPNYDGRNAGLFGIVDSNGRVETLNLADSYINGSTDIAGIVSHNYGMVENCNLAEDVIVIGTGATGGIVCRNMAGAEINLAVNRADITGAITGGIIAENKGDLGDGHNYGNINGTDSVGGLVGMNDGYIGFSDNAGDVTASGTHVGGVVGNHLGGEIDRGGNTGNVIGASDYIGGVAGACLGATIIESYNTGSVTGAEKSEAVGGVVGAIDGTNNAKSTLYNCYNTGRVSGRSWVGGIAGVSGYQKTPETVEIQNTYNTGSVSGTSKVGAVVGTLSKGTVSDTYYLTGSAQNTVNGATAASAEEFASGEIAAKLNEFSETSYTVWYQTLDLPGMEPDASPVMNREHGTVYYGYCDCTDFGYTNRENYNEPGEHVDEDGNMICDKCDTILGEVHEHEFGEWKRTKEPTCAEFGQETRICSICNYPQKRNIEKLPHTEEVIPGKSATLNEPGLSDGKICSVCQEVLVAQVELPVMDYNDGIIPLSVLKVSAGDWERNGGATEGPAELAVDDNFDTLWHTDWKGTSRANHWFQFEVTEDYVVDGLRYKPRGGNSTNGTITEYDIQVSDDGVTFRSVADGNWAGDSTWKVAEFDGEQVKFVRLVAVNALTDNSWVFASAAEIRLTGTKAGEQPHEHVFGEWTETKAPTCTEDGSRERVCECGEKETEVIAALGHDYVNGDCSRCDATLTSKFEDVPAGEFYFDPVEWAVEKGVTTGATETTFNPNGNCQRASVVTFLWRAAGSPEPTTKDNPFTDVNEGDFFYKAVLWAVEKGITNGMTTTSFGPYVECNRAQVVTFLWRSQGEPASQAKVDFTDVEAGQFYTTAVAWAVENQITNGMGGNIFGVDAICNRAQVVTFLYRTMNK